MQLFFPGKTSGKFYLLPEGIIVMENSVMGLHHITAIAGNAKQSFEFYTKVPGLRMVKKTVNFDDPGTYHFYFSDEVGTPGSILAFFPWEGIGKGYTGTGMATNIGYSVPKGSLEFREYKGYYFLIITFYLFFPLFTSLLPNVGRTDWRTLFIYLSYKYKCILKYQETILQE